MKDARQVVAEALCRMEREQSWSNLVFDSQMKKNPLGSRDSAFAGALFYGVLERRLTLDACIASFSTVKLRKLSSAVHAILRMGVYQLMYMDGVPDSAAISESVELARKLRQPKSAGFINAVLRNFVRAGKRVYYPKGATQEERLSLEFSCPVPLVRLWLDGYGEDMTRRILAGSLGRPPMTIRVNTLKTTPATLAGLFSAQNMEVSLSETLPACLTIRGTGAPGRLPQYEQGLFHIQDTASQLCALAVNPRPGMRVLDACAAPGGKSLTMAQMMENSGEILAADLHPHRVEMIRDRAGALGISIITPVEADMTIPHSGIGTFHRVLCDVPCSGLGVIRRKPEIKYKPLENLEKLSDIQYKILENSAHYCKVGGLLVYSTCTLNPGENEDVARRFLQANPGFLPHPLPMELGGGWSKTLLDEMDADGFFIACFIRSDTR